MINSAPLRAAFKRPLQMAYAFIVKMVCYHKLKDFQLVFGNTEPFKYQFASQKDTSSAGVSLTSVFKCLRAMKSVMPASSAFPLI
ncbi:hypothetical protein C6372_18520 [Bacillus halotolerans]|nr:hypothetical protein C6372_18520 [Bacillus halotolerans]